MKYGIVISDSASPILHRLLRGIRDRTYRKPVGLAGVRALRDHFTSKERDPSTHATANSLGAEPLGLFAEFNRRTSYEVTDRGVTLRVSHAAARQRYKGGRIKPVNVANLAIPARRESYGRSPLEFANLEVVYGRNGPYGLAASEGGARLKHQYTRGEKKGQEVERKLRGGRESLVLFWLVKEVNQAADETVLPTDDGLGDAIVTALRGWVDELETRHDG